MVRFIFFVILLVPSLCFGYGADVVTNGNFASGSSGWTDLSEVGATASFTAGAVILTGDATHYAWVEQAVTVTANYLYRVQLDASGIVVQVRVGTTSGSVNIRDWTTYQTGTGQAVHFPVPAATTTVYIQVRNSSATTATVDNLSVKPSHVNWWAKLAPSDINPDTCACSGDNCGPVGYSVTCPATLAEGTVETALSTACGSGPFILYLKAGAATWGGGFGVSNGTCAEEFYIIGSGVTTTTITADSTETYMFAFGDGVAWSSGWSSGFRGMAHFEAIGRNTSSSEFLSTVRNQEYAELSIHHLKLSKFGEYVGRITGYYGVIHNVEMASPYDADAGQLAYGFTVEGNGGWAGYASTTPTFGTRDWLFFEGNSWDAYGHELGGFCSVKYVFRYNTTTNDQDPLDVHDPGYNTCWGGSSTADNHGGRAIEVYRNSFTALSNIGSAAIDPRAGAGVIHSNSINNFQIGIQLTIDTNGSGPSCTSGDGCPWDYNFDGGNCSDAGDGCCEAPKDFWIWNNSYTGTTTEFQIERDPGNCMVENTIYWLSAKDGYAAFACPHPLTGLTGSCTTTAGTAGYNVAASSTPTRSGGSMTGVSKQ